MTIRSCLLRHSLPLVNLLEASLAIKEPPSGGANKWALKPFALELVKSLVLLCQTSCETLLTEWLARPHAR